MSCIEWANKTVGGVPATEYMAREQCPHPLTNGGILCASPPAWLPPHCFPVNSGLKASMAIHSRMIVSSLRVGYESLVRGGLGSCGSPLVAPHPQAGCWGARGHGLCPCTLFREKGERETERETLNGRVCKDMEMRFCAPWTFHKSPTKYP